MVGLQKRGRGRPPKTQEPGYYSSSHADMTAFNTIIHRMSNGEGLTTICREEDMPSYSMFITWTTSNPDLFDIYQRARQIQADYLADSIVEIADNEEDNYRAKNRMDARRWHASKLNSKKYGDKINTDHTQTVNQNIKVDLSIMSPEARQELREALLNQMRSGGDGKMINAPYKVLK